MPEVDHLIKQETARLPIVAIASLNCTASLREQFANVHRRHITPVVTSFLHLCLYPVQALQSKKKKKRKNVVSE